MYIILLAIQILWWNSNFSRIEIPIVAINPTETPVLLVKPNSKPENSFFDWPEGGKWRDCSQAERIFAWRQKPGNGFAASWRCWGTPESSSLCGGLPGEVRGQELRWLGGWLDALKNMRKGCGPIWGWNFCKIWAWSLWSYSDGLPERSAHFVVAITYF